MYYLRKLSNKSNFLKAIINMLSINIKLKKTKCTNSKQH